MRKMNGSNFGGFDEFNNRSVDESDLQSNAGVDMDSIANAAYDSMRCGTFGKKDLVNVSAGLEKDPEIEGNLSVEHNGSMEDDITHMMDEAGEMNRDHTINMDDFEEGASHTIPEFVPQPEVKPFDIAHDDMNEYIMEPHIAAFPENDGAIGMEDNITEINLDKTYDTDVSVEPDYSYHFSGYEEHEMAQTGDPKILRPHSETSMPEELPESDIDFEDMPEELPESDIDFEESESILDETGE